ncbi:hypothetical protein [Streptomyces sp. NRRL B-24484]|uniref:hypothetical protein n=1 Tax=Streptomyces sp. NRRL B-24484 TaxID=1463833 RepID=UPI0013311A38|nr:hypothetical protein [Streptomyces sp. NRRL B-24484]
MIIVFTLLMAAAGADAQSSAEKIPRSVEERCAAEDLVMSHGGRTVAAAVGNPSGASRTTFFQSLSQTADSAPTTARWWIQLA